MLTHHKYTHTHTCTPIPRTLFQTITHSYQLFFFSFLQFHVPSFYFSSIKFHHIFFYGNERIYSHIFWDKSPIFFFWRKYQNFCKLNHYFIEYKIQSLALNHQWTIFVEMPFEFYIKTVDFEFLGRIFFFLLFYSQFIVILLEFSIVLMI